VCLQLIGAVVGIFGSMMSDVPQLPASELLLGFAKPVFALFLLPALLLSLQRMLPRSERVAPALALVWAGFTVGVWMTAVPKPLPPALESMTFHDVAPPVTRIANLATAALAWGAMAWAVASLFVHRRTREYLAGESSGSVP
jgi:hypothetical protein